MAPIEQAASLQTLLNVFAYVTTVAAWLALVSLFRYQRQTQNPARLIFMLVWLGLSVVWWTVNTVLRLFFGYGPPTPIMSMTKTVIELQAFFSVILLFYLQRRHDVGHRHE